MRPATTSRTIRAHRRPVLRRHLHGRHADGVHERHRQHHQRLATLERNGASPVSANPATGFSGTINGVAYGPERRRGPGREPRPAPPARATRTASSSGPTSTASAPTARSALGAAAHVPGFPDVVSTHFDPGHRRPVPHRRHPLVRTRPTATSSRLPALLAGSGRPGRERRHLRQGQRPGRPRSPSPPSRRRSKSATASSDDTNRNGIQDAGEAGIGGVTVELWAVNGITPLASVDHRRRTAATTSTAGPTRTARTIRPTSRTPSPRSWPARRSRSAYSERRRRQPAGSARSASSSRKFNVQNRGLRRRHQPGPAQQRRRAQRHDGGDQRQHAVSLGASNAHLRCRLRPRCRASATSSGTTSTTTASFDSGETGINGIAVRLYTDANGDGTCRTPARPTSPPSRRRPEAASVPLQRPRPRPSTSSRSPARPASAAAAAYGVRSRQRDPMNPADHQQLQQHNNEDHGYSAVQRQQPHRLHRSAPSPSRSTSPPGQSRTTPAAPTSARTSASTRPIRSATASGTTPTTTAC